MNKFLTSEIRGNKILILGYGREGRSVHRFFTRFFPDIHISLADQKKIEKIDLPTVHNFFGTNYLDYLSEFDTVVRSPGIPLSHPKIQAYHNKGGWVTSSTNIFLSLFAQQVIGITGSKGKSTTSALVFEIIKTHFNDVQLMGNIGYPALDLVEQLTQKTKIVMELSSHQLEDVRFSPAIAIILRLFPEHLDYYPDYQSYIMAKLNISKWQSESDILVINEADTNLVNLIASSKAKKLYFSVNTSKTANTWVENEQIMVRQADKVFALMTTAEVGLKGLGNLENVLAAISVAKTLDVANEKIILAVSQFSGLPHRLEFVGTYKGIDFYNDSLSTAPEATIAACEALGENVYTLILGGLDRKLDMTKLVNHIIRKKHIKNLILFPQTGVIIFQLMRQKPNHGKNLLSVADMQSAVKFAYKYTPAGKICLLSPGAASFNLFVDYADRGDQFKKFVTAYGLA